MMTIYMCIYNSVFYIHMIIARSIVQRLKTEWNTICKADLLIFATEFFGRKISYILVWLFWMLSSTYSVKNVIGSINDF